MGSFFIFQFFAQHILNTLGLCPTKLNLLGKGIYIFVRENCVGPLRTKRRPSFAQILNGVQFLGSDRAFIKSKDIYQNHFKVTKWTKNGSI